MKKVIKIVFVILIILILLLIVGISTYFLTQKYKRVYAAKDFNIETVCSKIDYNQNGIDDYTDILQGARKDAEIIQFIKTHTIKVGIHQKMKEYVQMLFGVHLKMLVMI